MKKVLIFSFFLFAVLYGVFCSKVKPVNYGGSVNLIEVRGRGYDAVLVLRTLGYGQKRCFGAGRCGGTCNTRFAVFRFFEGLSCSNFNVGNGS